jgi:hypothetical protein
VQTSFPEITGTGIFRKNKRPDIQCIPSKKSCSQGKASQKTDNLSLKVSRKIP